MNFFLRKKFEYKWNSFNLRNIELSVMILQWHFLSLKLMLQIGIWQSQEDIYIYEWKQSKFKKSTEVLYPVTSLYITGNAIHINSILYEHGCNLSRMFSFKGEWWNSFWRSHSTILIDFINYYVILFSKPSLFCHFVRCIKLTRDVFIYSVSMKNFYNITK